MKQWKNGSIKYLDFDNIQEQKEYISEPVKTQKWETTKEIEVGNFYGKHTLAETMQGCDYGFQADTQKFIENLKETTNEDIGGENVYMDIEGFAYDMGAVVAGEPECCINFNTGGMNKTIKILVDIGFHSGTSADEIYNRSYALINLINTLINKKYIIELKFFNYNVQHDMSTIVTTKVNVDNLSLATIAFMSSPEFFRQVTWITRDELRNKESEPSRGKTEVNDILKNYIKQEDALLIKGSFMNKNFEREYRTKEQAEKTITNLFNEYCSQKGE